MVSAMPLKLLQSSLCLIFTVFLPFAVFPAFCCFPCLLLFSLPFLLLYFLFLLDASQTAISTLLPNPSRETAAHAMPLYCRKWRTSGNLLIESKVWWLL